MELRQKIDLLNIDVTKPVDEIKEAVIAISIFSGPNQIEVLKQVEMWLGETIEEAEKEQAKQQNPEVNEGPAEAGPI
ncbi:hypothetical protein [Cohnella sp.]|uniref:hypothetical protein n=1 Tax=Cohnella sp. TaxID=1883426 RepID=UPI003703EDD8